MGSVVLVLPAGFTLGFLAWVLSGRRNVVALVLAVVLVSAASLTGLVFTAAAFSDWPRERATMLGAFGGALLCAIAYVAMGRRPRSVSASKPAPFAPGD